MFSGCLPTRWLRSGRYRRHVPCHPHSRRQRSCPAHRWSRFREEADLSAQDLGHWQVQLRESEHGHRGHHRWGGRYRGQAAGICVCSVHHQNIGRRAKIYGGKINTVYLYLYECSIGFMDALLDVCLLVLIECTFALLDVCMFYLLDEWMLYLLNSSMLNLMFILTQCKLY